jgi:hypothetical protein
VEVRRAEEIAVEEKQGGQLRREEAMVGEEVMG